MTGEIFNSNIKSYIMPSTHFSGSWKPVNSFSQQDINYGYVLIWHDGSMPSSGVFTFSVKNGQNATFNSSSYSVEIRIDQTQTVQLHNFSTVIWYKQGDSSVVMSRSHIAVDTIKQSSANDIRFTILSGPQNGTLMNKEVQQRINK